MILCDFENLPNKFWSLSKIFLDELGPYNSQESSRGLIGDGLGQESLSSTWLTVQDNTFWWFDTDVFIKLRISERKLNGLLNLPNLSLKSSNISI